MAKWDIMEIVGQFSEQTLKFFDDAYKQGWLIYLLVGLLVLFVVLLFQRGTYTPDSSAILNITADITRDITAEVTESTIVEFVSGCTTVLGLAEGTSDFNFCEERIRKGFELTDFRAEDCSLCGQRPNFPNEEGLCLTGADVPFCEGSVSQIEEVTAEATEGARDLPIAQFGSFVTTYTDFFDRIVPEKINVGGFQTNGIVLWIVGLFSLGFLVRFFKIF